MLFPAQEVVTSMWKRVVEGMIASRLGPTAKVATDDGNPGGSLDMHIHQSKSVHRFDSKPKLIIQRISGTKTMLLAY